MEMIVNDLRLEMRNIYNLMNMRPSHQIHEKECHSVYRNEGGGQQYGRVEENDDESLYGLLARRVFGNCVAVYGVACGQRECKWKEACGCWLSPCSKAP